MQIFIKNSTTIGWSGILSKTAGGPPETTNIIIPTASEGYYHVFIDVDSGTWQDTELNAVIVDNTGPTVNLSYPNGGECLAGSASGNVTWNDSDFYSTRLTYSVDLSYDCGLTYPDNLARGSAAEGYHSPGVTWPDAMYYKLCKVQVTVTDDAGNSTSDVSTSTFTIDNTNPTVTLASPTGGETWHSGSSHDITWIAVDSGNPDNLDYLIEYTLDSTASPVVWTTAASQTDQAQGNCTYSWTVPDAHSTHCQVKVTATDCAGHTGSDIGSDFIIDDTTAPTCEVTSPNGGERWAQGSTKLIAWTANDNVSGNNMTYELWYCTDYTGTTWKHITTLYSQPQGNQTYPWTVDSTPVILTSDSPTCRVKVKATDVGGNSTEDISDANFTITVDNTAPTVTLTDPTGTWKAGTCQTISWTASDNTATDTLTVKLEYKESAGAWTEITTLRGVAQGSSSYTWAIPSGAVGSTTIRITVTDESGNNSTPDTSTAVTVNAADAGYLEAPDIVLAAGWNLISLPLIPPCTDIESVLGDCIPNVLSVWGYSGGSSGTWSSYAPGAPSSLTEIEDGKAYWINMSGIDTLNVKGVKCYTGPGSTPPQYSYVAGWNLVGFKSTVNEHVEDYLGGTCGTTYAEPIYKYDTVSGTYDDKNCTEDMEPCYGYWVYFNSATTVSPGCN